MTNTINAHFRNFDQSFQELQEATSLTRKDKAQRLMSQVDVLFQSEEGIQHLYENALELEKAGIFDDSPWKDPNRLAPPLVKGTILAGHPNSTIEMLSELRVLAYARGLGDESYFSVDDASSFLEEVLVLNLEFAYDELTEESREKLSDADREKIVRHFQFVLENAELSGIKTKLAEEMRMVCAQRPVVTATIRGLIKSVRRKMTLDGSDPADEDLQYYVNAVYQPSKLSADNQDHEAYRAKLAQCGEQDLVREAESIAHYLHNTGLTNPYLAILLRHLVENHTQLVPILLRLGQAGKSEWLNYREFAGKLVLEVFSEHNYRGVYGLKRMLERRLFSRSEVRTGLDNLRLIKIEPMVEERILKSVSAPTGDIKAKQYLLGALISLLGQPIGIGQGNNATCQSARGISMWAQHSPAKLINMISTVATTNNLIFRFENQELETMKLAKGLVNKLDHQLDAVSVTLVPHLDKIYNEMMRRAAGRGEDPHKWVNPAMYGQWIPNGFASAYNYLLNAVQDFPGFVRHFYACVHPQYNGGRKMVYPNPVGIFITSSKGDMLGFHAISLLRVAKNPESAEGEVRAYFLNPNNEGRQNWGQQIKPAVIDNGELPGESSLPIEQFAARTYAFHFPILEVKQHLSEVPNSEIAKVEKLARESWGRTYQWSNIEKAW